MEEISQRGSATKQIIHHIAIGVESNSEKKSFTDRFFGTSSPTLDPILHKAYEVALSPWPYNLITFIPSWIRVVVIILAVLLLFRCCSEPLTIMGKAIRDTSVDKIASICPTHFTKTSPL